MKAYLRPRRHDVGLPGRSNERNRRKADLALFETFLGAMLACVVTTVTLGILLRMALPIVLAAVLPKKENVALAALLGTMALLMHA